MLATPIHVLPAPAPSALSLYDTLINLAPQVSITAGQWIDCATRLEIEASKAHFQGQAGRKQKLRDRADHCREIARKSLVIEVVA